MWRVQYKVWQSIGRAVWGGLGFLAVCVAVCVVAVWTKEAKLYIVVFMGGVAQLDRA